MPSAPMTMDPSLARAVGEVGRDAARPPLDVDELLARPDVRLGLAQGVVEHLPQGGAVEHAHRVRTRGCVHWLVRIIYSLEGFYTPDE